MNPLHPKKLLLTKWTAVAPVCRNLHFLVTKVIEPDPPETAIRWIDIEAVHSRSVRRIEWRELKDSTRWRQGWV
ncbi:TIGR02450 family Trp-rich protein [Methyloversatilis sp.]|uniref:TIGR02450 family Trp-rich protein n=1 Tax=Methyloversatilis sp. TaxID=2569862 RepID=UPI0027324A1B|nr:TIGR02450 family Trp-rich protein [Methyloversatilis sp.]MDP2868882.1 TIGR02450 family Trp-rich protein [Methyloversatilis sp.]MDP3288321.1 TIGR02450 family Trp-rich protein [Methyloversatilis sp.]MDP3454041.1 TIGR02450 family Trp-rich protein [Methyloversatilis sp.]MDP3578027.1 TIGR02450 family Trp-rich protein [Methyloversatilis sp.]